MIDENEKDFLKFYMEQTWEEMRHIENIRERVTILVVTVASAIVGFIIQQKFAIETKPFAWFVIILGVFGFLMTLKLFQIHQMSQKRLNKWNIYLESFCGNDPQILKLRSQADVENKKDFFYIVKIPHNYFWSAIHLFIFGAGFLLLTMYPNPTSTRMERHCSHSTISTSTNKTIVNINKIK
jgi:uncharacterized membrane protein YfcA